MFRLRTTPLKYSIQALKKITIKAEIRLQLESRNIVLSEISLEWTFLEFKLAKWSKNDFPPESGESIGMKFDGLSNLFHLIDYFLTLSVSSAEAERGFSILKSLKPSKRKSEPKPKQTKLNFVANVFFKMQFIWAYILPYLIQINYPALVSTL